MRRLVLVTLLAACGSKSTTSDGPAFTPLIANHLRAIAPDCALQRTEGEIRTCKGPRATVVITLDKSERLRALDIDFASMFFQEAKIFTEQALTGLVDTTEITGRMQKLKIPEQQELVVGAAHVTVGAKGESRAAPEFSVHIRW